MGQTAIQSIVYGPVPSWRLGRSLGIDPISTQCKTCPFDCVYCQLGRTRCKWTERRVFVSPEALREQLLALGQPPIDTLTFSGVGEPTLAANLRSLVGVVREVIPDRPVAVLTNAALMGQPDVRSDLQCFDIVVAKVDAPSEELFRAINRPAAGISLAQIIEGICELRGAFSGKLALQMMFVPANRHAARQMAALARRLHLDEVQLNTPLRPSPVDPLSPTEMEAIEVEFDGLPSVNVYTAPRPEIVAVDEESTRRRRPREGRAKMGGR